MDLIPIYSIPLWQSEYPEFEENKELFLDTIKKYKEQDLSKENSYSNTSGYESSNKLQEVQELSPLYEYICQLGFAAVNQLDFVECDIAITSAWVNINDSRQCMKSTHTHKHTFSGVFYLKAPENSGKLVLQNPGINCMWDGCDLVSTKNQFTAKNVSIEPIEGNIILFPSYLPHSVETNDHDEERISISFTMIVIPKNQIDT